jgi:hypothetical protein
VLRVKALHELLSAPMMGMPHGILSLLGGAIMEPPLFIRPTCSPRKTIDLVDQTSLLALSWNHGFHVDSLVEIIARTWIASTRSTTGVVGEAMSPCWFFSL